MAFKERPDEKPVPEPEKAAGWRREALRNAAGKGMRGTHPVPAAPLHEGRLPPAAKATSPAPTQQRSVFVSYAHEDLAIAQVLVQKLRARGVVVGWDQEFPSGSLSRLIKKSIDEATCVIAVWSPVSCVSPWVEGEATHARKCGKLISTHVEGFNIDDLSLQFCGLNSVPVTDLVRISDSLAQHGFTITL